MAEARQLRWCTEVHKSMSVAARIEHSGSQTSVDIVVLPADAYKRRSAIGALFGFLLLALRQSLVTSP
jgi:hypothetical protein